VPPARMNMPITVSTVGFQVRPHQQQALDQIAAAGGGRSAGAANMAQLASAFQTAVQAAAPTPAPPPAPVARAPMSSGGGGMLVRRSRWSGPGPWVVGALVALLLATIGYAAVRRYGPLPALARTGKRPVRMRVRHADGREQVVALERLPLSIGRRKGNDLVLDDAGVSREHAHIVERAGQVLVEDNGSAGGTFLGRRRVSSAVLRQGSVLVLGDTHISFEA